MGLRIDFVYGTRPICLLLLIVYIVELSSVVRDDLIWHLNIVLEGAPPQRNERTRSDEERTVPKGVRDVERQGINSAQIEQDQMGYRFGVGSAVLQMFNSTN
jgi:hypothetical protein